METKLKSSEQSRKPEICALIAVLTLPSSDTCSCPSQTKDRGTNQHKHICIRSQFTLERVQMLWEMDPNNLRCSLIKITLFPLVLISHTYKQFCLLCIDFMDKHTYTIHTYMYVHTHTHQCKHTEATINYSHPIWEH